MPATRTPLSITGAEEDYPRLLTAYKKARGLELALALPNSGSPTLVAVYKDGTAFISRDMTWPSTPLPGGADEAVQAIASAKKEAASKAGPVMLRGKWIGKLHVDVALKTVQVELYRRIATYGKLIVRSQNTGRWVWRFERAEKWFTAAGQTESDVAASTLSLAIANSYAGVQGLVREACGVKETRRRAALDADFATRHPIKIRPPARDRTIAFIERKRPVPKTTRAAKQAAAKVVKDAAQVVKAIDTGAVTEAVESSSVDAVVNYFINNQYTFSDLFERIHDYSRGLHKPEQNIPLDVFIDTLKTDAQALLKDQGHTAKAPLWQEAIWQIKALDAALRTEPAMLARTRALLEYAKAIIDSPKCTGSDKTEAEGLHAAALAKHNEARQDFIEGASSLRNIRQAAEWAALGAAKAASACGAGQTSLTAKMRSKSPKAPPPLSKNIVGWPPGARLMREAVGTLPAGWRLVELGDRAVRFEQEGGGHAIEAHVQPTYSAKERGWKLLLMPPGKPHKALKNGNLFGVDDAAAAIRVQMKRHAVKGSRKPASSSAFQPRTFTVEIPQSGSKRKAFDAAQEHIRAQVLASQRQHLTFLPAKRGSWTLGIVANTAASSTEVESILSTLDFDAIANVEKVKKAAKRKTAKKPARSVGGLSAEKTTLLQQAFSSAISDVVQQLRSAQ